MVRTHPLSASLLGLLGLLAFLPAGCVWDHVLGYGPEDPNPDAHDNADGADLSNDAPREAIALDAANDEQSDASLVHGRADAGADAPAFDASSDGSLDAAPDGPLSVPEASAADAVTDRDASSTVVLSLSNPICSTDGWCWMTPLPQGNDISSVWGSASNDVWAIGAESTLLHYDGSAWSGAITGPAYDLIPYLGGAEIATQGLVSIAGSSASDVWAVGRHIDGFGETPDYVGEILHFDGSMWSENPGGALAQTLAAVWVGGPTEAWAVGRAVHNQSWQAIFLYWNGTSWSDTTPAIANAVPSDGSGSGPSDVWGSGPNDVWVLDTSFVGLSIHDRLLHFDGSTWNDALVAEGGLSFTSVRGTSSSDVWVAAGDGLHTELEHWNGSAWSTTNLDVPGDLDAGSAAPGSDDVWIVNGGKPWHFDGKAWQTSPSLFPVTAVSRVGDSDIWAAGQWGYLEHFDGSSWSWSSHDVETRAFEDVWGSNENDLWAAGYVWTSTTTTHGAIFHWDGNAWSAASTFLTPTELSGIWGMGADLWAVGSIARTSGMIAHGNTGGTFTTVTPNTAALIDVKGTGASDLWAVGDGGTILHSDDGVSWGTSPSGTSSNLTSVCAIATNDAWTVGAAGTVLHWDGAIWNAVATGSSEDLDSVWASGKNDVWAAGAKGTVLHWDGSEWSSSNLTLADLLRVWGTGPSDVWVTGGMTYHWDGKSWTRSDTGTQWNLAMRAGWSNARAALVAGTDGEALVKRLRTPTAP